MSLAPAAYLLFQKVMRHDPADPDWTGRDRFVLSAGHTSLTLYTQLYLAGYGLELDDLKAFRTWGSQDPGPPGVRPHRRRGDHHRPAGPGRRQRGRHGDGRPLRARPVRPGGARGTSPFDHTIWAIVSDGDLQEGISAEASSLAGHQKLGNLVAAVRRQPHLHRGRHRDRLLRGRPQAVRGVRLARAAHRAAGPNGDLDVHALYAALAGGPGRVPTAPRSSRCARSSPGRPRTRRTPRPRTARRSATTRSPPPSASSASTPSSTSRSPTRSSRTPAQALRPRPRGARRLGQVVRRVARRQPGARRRVRPDHRRRAARGLGGRAAGLRGGQGASPPARPPARSLQALGAVHPGAVGRLGRPGRLQQHHDRQDVLLPPGGQPAAGGGPVRPHHPLRHPRARHGRGA